MVVLVHHIKSDLTFLTMMGRDAVGSTRVTSATLHLACTGCNQLHPLHYLDSEGGVVALLPPTYRWYQFTDPGRMDSLVS